MTSLDSAEVTPRTCKPQTRAKKQNMSYTKFVVSEKEYFLSIF